MVRFLDSISESLHRQIFLEAKIMEVRLNDTYKYGIDWGSMNIDFTSSSSKLPDNLGISFNSGGTVALANQSSLNLILDFLRTQGDVSVLSNPHLSVMNGRSAVMTVGFQFPYGDVTGVDRDPETGVITFGTSIKRTVLGLQLGITPQISSDGIVTLHIVPTITRIQGEENVELPTSVNTTQTISNPVIDLQELATTVRVRAGDSVVLAGLISQIKQLNHEGLPFLSKIPILKYLFKKAEDQEESRELVIFITPYIKKIG
jgi:MSHA type pilus biogenesis protein MshL